MPLDCLVARACSRRANFDDQLRRAAYVQRRDDRRGALVREIEKVGLHDVEM
jgi:hypothetical protein